MTLTMRRGRTGVRFEFTDGEVESSVTLLPEDDEATLVRKLRRVVELVEGDLPPVGQGGKVVTLPSSVPPPAPAEFPQLGEKQVTNGWEMIKGGD